MFKYIKTKVADGIYYVVKRTVISHWMNRDHDPIKYCEVYKEEGCGYINGPLCDMSTCSLRKCNGSN